MASKLEKLQGKNVFIRCVTLYYTGKLESVDGDIAELSSAAWVADTGRFATALETGKLSEVEPFPADAPVYVNLGAMVDAVEWTHDLPTKQK
jgi:hypothetical protein